MSSVQLQRYLASRFVEGLSRDDAAFEAGFSIEEAKLTDKDVERGAIEAPGAVSGFPSSVEAAETDAAERPPAVLPLRSAHSPETVAPEPGPSRLLAAITPFNPEEKTMARAPKKAAEQDNQEVKEPDFEKAVRIFRQDIKPANEKSGEFAQTASTGYKAIKKDCHVNTRAAKFVFQLAGESEEKRNDVLRSVRGLLGEMNIGITDDLVSKAEGDDGKAPIIPTAAPERPALATVQ